MLKNKKDIKNLFLLLGIFAIVIVLTTRFNYIYGSKVDWESQHFAFPEYFRSLFYSTHNLFPSFAFNIGAGQNIYYFSYYGLFSPVFLISYLFPILKMANYVMISSIVIVIITYILFYYFLRRNKFSSNVCFFATLIFLCASPLIFHSHRHIMFISFLPMLLLGMIGVDRYFEKNKKFLLTFSLFLMIMTSYYYSVGGMCVIAIYGIYKYLSVTKKVTIKDFVKNALKFCVPIIVSILLAGVLLLPTIGIILNSRAEKISDTSLLNYLIPNVNLENLLYTPYSLGLTSIVIFALVSLFFSKKKEDKFLTIVLSLIIIIPIFVYFLNGKLYLESKCLISFLPLYTFVIAKFIKNLKNSKYDKKFSIIIILVIAVLALLQTETYISVAFLVDAFLFSIFLHISKKKQKPLYLVYVVILSTVLCIIVNSCDPMLSKKDFNSGFSDVRKDMITEVIKEDKDFYRFNNQLDKLLTVNSIYNMNYYTTSIYSSTFNKYYNHFYYDIFNVEMPFRNSSITSANNNLLFDNFMGVKYVMTSDKPSPHHELVKEKNNTKIFENKSVLPLGFASSTLFSEKDFYKSEYPYYLDSFFKGIITENTSNSKIKSNIKKTNLDLEFLESNNIKITKKNSYYNINSKENGYIKYRIKNMPKNSMLLIRFNLLNEPSCETGDIYITINDVRNKLTCKEWKYANKNKTFDFLVSDEKDLEKLNIVFSKGNFKIANIETFVLNYDDVKYNGEFDKFEISKIKGDVIRGTIDVKKDGYFTMTIPYDKGFSAYVDGEKVNVEKVNTSFIGFQISKGHHTIEIVYEAPYQTLGLILSLIGVVGLTIIVVIDSKVKK